MDNNSWEHLDQSILHIDVDWKQARRIVSNLPLPSRPIANTGELPFVLPVVPPRTFLFLCYSKHKRTLLTRTSFPFPISISFQTRIYGWMVPLYSPIWIIPTNCQ